MPQDLKDEIQKKCKCIGHDRMFCPVLPCVLCRRRDHNLRKCPHFGPRCKNCGKKGHDYRHCSLPIRPGFQPPLPPRVDRSRPNTTDSFESQHVHPSLRCPNFVDCISYLILALIRNNDPRLSHIPYKSVIDHCGGTQPVMQVLIESIDPAIRALEGQEITVQKYVAAFKIYEIC